MVLKIRSVHTATVIPDNERQMHTPSVKNDLTAASTWTQKTLVRATDPPKLKMAKAHGAKRNA